MAIEIKTPYDHTPYDVFSDAGDPKVGVLTPDSNRNEVAAQYAKILKQHKKDTREVNIAYDALRNGSARMSWDIFLTTTLMRSTELGDMIGQYQKPAVPAMKDPDWGAEMSWAYQSPENRIELIEQTISHRNSYDAPPAQAGGITFEA